jgi:hypothetical protein
MKISQYNKNWLEGDQQGKGPKRNKKQWRIYIKIGFTAFYDYFERTGWLIHQFTPAWTSDQHIYIYILYF